MADTPDVQRESGVRRGFDHADEGSSLIEMMIAMVVIMAVLLGLLTTLGAAASGIATARQRTIAVSLAKQAIENLQGSNYDDVMSGSGVKLDPLVSGTKFDLASVTTFNSTKPNEELVEGGSPPYSTTVVEAGSTFLLRTFVTKLSPDAGYHRITVIVDWPATSSKHTMRFTSFVSRLDYTSYPSSGGSAQTTGGLLAVCGHVGNESYDDLHVALPGALADASVSTLRTAIGSAASAASRATLFTGPVPSPICTSDVGSEVVDCPRQTIDSTADNDLSTAPTPASATGQSVDCTAPQTRTPAGIIVGTPHVTMTSNAKTDTSSTCSLCDPDSWPWADSTAKTTTTSSVAFTSGAVHGRFWNLSSNWIATASVDRDLTNTDGIVSTSATLTAPLLHVLELDSAPPTFVGAVTVNPFVATATASSGYTTSAPTVVLTSGSSTVKVWNGTGYSSVNWVPATGLDVWIPAELAPKNVITIGDREVSFRSHVQSEPPATFAAAGTAPRTDASAQHSSSLLLVTVEVTITAPSVTDPPNREVVDEFSIVVDYGRVSAHGTWLTEAPAP